MGFGGHMSLYGGHFSYSYITLARVGKTGEKLQELQEISQTLAVQWIHDL